MSWDSLQKPLTGSHWWYRLLTGRKYTYPFMDQVGLHIYWKRNLKTKEVVPCRFLNLKVYAHFRWEDIKSILKAEYTYEELKKYR